MKSILYVALPSEPDGKIQIARERGDRLELINHRGPFGAIDCVAFAPATAVGHFRAVVPGRNEADSARAALYAIEDELAQPVEDVHVALGPRAKGSTERDIYVVDRAQMKFWIELLSKAGLSPERILPEQCLFTDIDQPVDLGDRILQRDGNRIIGIDVTLPPQAREALSGSDEAAEVQDGLHLIRLAERSAASPGVNLRTGAFALAKDRKKGVSAWRKAAGIAIAAVSVWSGTLILEARNYNHATSLLKERAAERYAAIFPVAAIPADMDRATREMLSLAVTPDTIDYRTSVAALYEAVALAPDTRIAGLSFDGAASRLTADIQFPTQDAVASASSFLQSRGFQVTTSTQTDSQATQIILEPVP